MQRIHPVLVVAALLLGACASQTTSTQPSRPQTVAQESTTSSTTSTSTPTTTTSEAVVVSGTVFQITMDNAFFAPSQLLTTAGISVVFNLENTAPAESQFSVHDFVVVEGVFDNEDEYRDAVRERPELLLLDSGLMAPGDTRELAITFEDPGTYQIICSIETHMAAGMHGLITVEG